MLVVVVVVKGPTVMYISLPNVISVRMGGGGDVLDV